MICECGGHRSLVKSFLCLYVVWGSDSGHQVLRCKFLYSVSHLTVSVGFLFKINCNASTFVWTPTPCLHSSCTSCSVSGIYGVCDSHRGGFCCQCPVWQWSWSVERLLAWEGLHDFWEFSSLLSLWCSGFHLLVCLDLLPRCCFRDTAVWGCFCSSCVFD